MTSTHNPWVCSLCGGPTVPRTRSHDEYGRWLAEPAPLCAACRAAATEAEQAIVRDRQVILIEEEMGARLRNTLSNSKPSKEALAAAVKRTLESFKDHIETADVQITVDAAGACHLRVTVRACVPTQTVLTSILVGESWSILR